MIIPVGVNIFPSEVEALLPSTRQFRSRVVGVPDERLGRRPRGVVPRPVTRSNCYWCACTRACLGEVQVAEHLHSMNCTRRTLVQLTSALSEDGGRAVWRMNGWFAGLVYVAAARLPLTAHDESVAATRSGFQEPDRRISAGRFSPLVHSAARFPHLILGTLSSVVHAGPALLAMSGAALAEVTFEQTYLGIGSSSNVNVHG